MKVHLMYPDRDFDSEFKLKTHEEILTSDLELDMLFDAMAGKDELIRNVVKSAIFGSLVNSEGIFYRQAIVKDCIKNSTVVRELYHIATETIEHRRDYWWGISSMYLSSILSTSVGLLQMFVEMLKKIRHLVDDNAGHFESAGFTALFSMLQEELSDEYFSLLDTHLNELRFRGGTLISAELGSYNQGIHYVLRRQENKKRCWLKWHLAPRFYISPRDDNGCTDLSKRRERAINNATNTLAQSAEHVLSFFTLLRTELAFYVGCLNLYDRLAAKGEPIAFPSPYDSHDRRHSFEGLYDVSLALIIEKKVVGNQVGADNKDFVIITGANQGGKSTFLRSIGQAQLMMQCGMFVAAESFGANIASGVFTHFKKEEDATMQSGKLDEELGRMSDIAEEIKPGALILFNESFSATNEREGSEIGRQIVRALLEKHIKVFFVTHFYDFAHGFYKLQRNDLIFLRAERQEDGRRTFQLSEGEPLRTSYGEDVYKKIFK
jgi:hypothetical protein